ncbi:MAG: flavodoxin [Acutalibacteraceae bacterium]
MKKFSVTLLSILLLFALTACQSQNDAESDISAESTKDAQFLNNDSVSENQPSESQNNASDKKILIVYYSATGTTKRVAEQIASATGGDLFELEPVEPYSENDLDWTDENSRVVKEHNNPDERKVELKVATVDNWSEYDTVLIGYPIWWGIAAWPTNGFVETNDFSGKTVIPFCTSASSGLGQSGELLEEAAGTGNWLDGKRFSSGESETEILNWIESLGL